MIWPSHVPENCRPRPFPPALTKCNTQAKRAVRFSTGRPLSACSSFMLLGGRTQRLSGLLGCPVRAPGARLTVLVAPVARSRVAVFAHRARDIAGYIQIQDIKAGANRAPVAGAFNGGSVLTHGIFEIKRTRNHHPAVAMINIEIITRPKRCIVSLANVDVEGSSRFANQVMRIDSPNARINEIANWLLKVISAKAPK